MLMVNNFTGFGVSGASTPPPSPVDDTWWDQVVLSVHGNGDLLDAKAHTITPSGGATTSALQKKFGSGAVAFDGAGDYLTATASQDWVLFGKFTIEMWVYITAYDPSGSWLVTLSGPGYSLGVLPTGAIQFIVHPFTPVVVNSSVGIFQLGEWAHLAVARDSAEYRIYYNGAEVAALTSSVHPYGSSNTLLIGAYIQPSNYDLNGYIDDLRITKGVCRYEADFDVNSIAENQDAGQEVDPYWSSVVLGLHMNGLNNGTVFHDEKGKTVTPGGQVKTVTSTYPPITGAWASAYFDGNGDYLSIPDSVDFEFGSGSFTIDCWVNRSASGAQTLYSHGGNENVVYERLYLGFDINNKLTAALNSSSASNTNQVSLIGTTTVTTGGWHHIALVRDGTNVKIFLNGTLEDSDTFSLSLWDSTTAVYIGILLSNSSPTSIPFTGYIADLRVTKGVARYTANFDVPTRMFPRN